jgi:ribonucleoside-diphosphate reductase alpha chain
LSKITDESPVTLNAQLNLWSADRKVQFDKDKEAARQFFLQVVNAKTRHFYSLEEKLDFLFENGYYEKAVWDQYPFREVKKLYKKIYDKKHRFESYFSAFKFYDQYAMKSFDGEIWMERYEDRVVANALLLGQGDVEKANYIAEEIISGRLQPATPTFSNAGKVARGEFVSCFLLRIEDSMESIGRGINSALQLSKRGGGVALLLSNIREAGAPIKGILNMSSGIIPVMKLLEDSFSYANQLGTRQGAGAVYLNAFHPDIMKFLDTKRENADEKVRIKTLSTGVVIPDILFELAKNNEEMYLFSPYDVQREYGVPFADISISEKYREMVNNPRIKKTKPKIDGERTINAREFFTQLAEIQFESGYPYSLFEDNANRDHAIAGGRINMSNLCTEILQVNTASKYNNDLSYSEVGRDISCNLASLNVAKTMEGGNLRRTVETAINALTTVSDISNMDSVPSIVNGNDKSHSVGLGQMNLAGFFIKEGMKYGDENSLNFTNIYFMTVAFEALRASARIAKRYGKTFEGFEESKYADRAYLTEKYSNPELITPNENTSAIFAKYGIPIPTEDDWAGLACFIEWHGLYNAYLQAIPPTGSISYINYSTSSIHPVAAAVEARKEGRSGRVYFPQPYVTNENFHLVEDAYQVGWKRVIDVYAEATKHVDQGLSLTLFYANDATTKTINQAQIYAWRKGIKTLYYARVRQDDLKGTEMEECVACSL